ncbi:phage portal, SPP1 Gp6-like family protein [Mycobacteroides abscessus subsp. abscessus]|uniref:phage portal protein n=1 Tax=Mycobacteroides abscessus TaxID=36809 RepID=UPI00092C88F4|nr:phage portal protein [Mycobacteroides abscessus]SHP46011.1 Phage portal protein, SPP1 Gp6-like [Mycobacteroides abscessus subsp. abscessus]SIE30244.1 phage portal, SPP1 Gp6-like family protein [Mycobacteroides abscessus subsp. abscessus]SIE49536.1 phage portal, SPP1 Gp6-like family protein [Mycobacteroides abscessus subsp. abscessus]SIF01043.1 phage portal, SPP1 Gp6-like family protein [Mycobacteroides abscessus subsp. abscessus]SKU68421.1 Phage portal protein, SPP1 Gp6-like [Mycobacteroide
MKVSKITLPDFTNDENALLNGLLQQLADCQPNNRLRASYYDGKRAIRQVGSIIPRQYYKLGLVLGWSAKAVDVLARRCNLDGYVWPGQDLNSLGFQEVWDDNYFGAESNSAIVSSLIHGLAFLINTVGGADEPKSLIHVKDALNATGEWNSRTRRLDNLLSIIAWDKDGNPEELALYLHNRTAIAQRDRGKWTVQWTEHKYGVPAEALVYKPRVGRPFGSSRISRPVMSIHDRALRVLIRTEGHADIFSYPELWMLGADSSIFKNPDGSLKPSWQVMLGRIKGIPDNEDAVDPKNARADIKQFQAASPQPHLDLLQQCANDFSGETDLPVSALGVQARTNTTTADGSDNAEKQLIAEAEGATDDWSPAFRRSMMRALAIKNNESQIPAAWRSIDTKWRPHAYISRAAQADAGLKQLSAIPWLAETEVGLELLGLPQQMIDRALSERDRAQRARQITALVDKLTGAPIPDPAPGTAEQAAQQAIGNGSRGL